MNPIASFLTRPVTVLVLVSLLAASLIYNGVQYWYIQLTEAHLQDTRAAYEFMRDRLGITQSDLEASMEKLKVYEEQTMETLRQAERAHVDSGESDFDYVEFLKKRRAERQKTLPSITSGFNVPQMFKEDTEAEE